MPVTLCVLLTAVPGNVGALAEYEDQVLARLESHGAALLSRVRTIDPDDAPQEVHLIEFPSEAALQEYMDDPVRVALADLRERAIAHTEVLRVEAVS